jgi:hypothetical protein
MHQSTWKWAASDALDVSFHAHNGPIALIVRRADFSLEA